MQDQHYKDTILKYLNAPQDDLLTREVNEMRNLSPENEQYFQEIKKIWEASAQTAVLFQLDHKASVRNFRNKLSQTIGVSTGGGFNWIRNIAAILVLSVLAFWFYSKETAVTYLVKETSGKIDSVSLNDGTKIMLAEHTAISYPEKFKGKERVVSLLKGQAFFKVFHDANHPFHVMILNSKVSVLGTSFNIMYSPSEINVSVKTGKVMFTPNRVSEPAILTAGQAISYNYVQNNLTLREAVNANSWLTKELQFVDMPLDEVCKQLGEYYHVKIDLYDKKHTVKKFNANFKDSSLEEVLTVLKETYQIEINKRDSIITIKSI